jgi:hypothetical protein
MARKTLLDIAIANAADPARELIEEAVYDTPEVSGRCRWTGNTVPGVGGAGTIRGLLYKTRVRTSLPAAGFRDANDGPTATKATYENRVVEAFFFNPRSEVDAMVAESDERGADVCLAEDAEAQLKGAFRQLSMQFYYGTNALYGGVAKGNPGLIDAVPAANVVDALGDEAATASSVWFVKWGPNELQWVLGNNGSFEVEDPRLGDFLGTNNALLTGWITEMRARIGLQIANPVRALARIKNLTAATDATGQLSDAWLSKGLEKMSEPPDAIFMAKRSWFALQRSRTATTTTGAEAPLPKDFMGIPILISEGISITEAVGY